MIFKILVVLHALGATVWAGGHLVLAIAVLPKALNQQDPDLIKNFEENFETMGLVALAIQVLTGIGLAWIYLPGVQDLLKFESFLSTYIAIKLGLLLATIALAVHARFWIMPRLSKQNLTALGLHIAAVATLAVAFVIVGAGIRLGGLT
ncbi:hypothetical protein Pse7367_1407 [Thalassoporum mexicanum PCC 7367]|uniref:CopD family protein n=1 Tax=Thalassoporum mexicanum TaxID=3457544 RepID=UPI00029FC357|nr:CopD family protein [Pseudanabaena sp. PCC 7367]AFY69698.1 hypothetical protein Pse7367_1407 [Pseudanabaena sp. PCC 7367]